MFGVLMSTMFTLLLMSSIVAFCHTAPTSSPSTSPTYCDQFQDRANLDSKDTCTLMYEANLCDEHPDIYARCNFTCTGCTASPTTSPTTSPSASPTTSPTDCTDLLMTGSYVDSFPKAICATSKANGHCSIPKLALLCNLTCSSCTESPTSSPTSPTTSPTSAPTFPPTAWSPVGSRIEVSRGGTIEANGIYSATQRDNTWENGSFIYVKLNAEGVVTPGAFQITYGPWGPGVLENAMGWVIVQTNASNSPTHFLPYSNSRFGSKLLPPTTGWVVSPGSLHFVGGKPPGPNLRFFKVSTPAPTHTPTTSPTNIPTTSPTTTPTTSPTNTPTTSPTSVMPTASLTNSPSSPPTISPASSSPTHTFTTTTTSAATTATTTTTATATNTTTTAHSLTTSPLTSSPTSLPVIQVPTITDVTPPPSSSPLHVPLTTISSTLPPTSSAPPLSSPSASPHTQTQTTSTSITPKVPKASPKSPSFPMLSTTSSTRTSSHSSPNEAMDVDDSPSLMSPHTTSFVVVCVCFSFVVLAVVVFLVVVFKRKCSSAS